MANEFRGKKMKKEDSGRIQIFKELGCSDFELEPLRSFYFSLTRKNTEPHNPQAKAGYDMTSLVCRQL